MGSESCNATVRQCQHTATAPLRSTQGYTAWSCDAAYLYAVLVLQLLENVLTTGEGDLPGTALPPDQHPHPLHPVCWC